MLKKVIAIRNIGKFRKCCAAGDVQFGKATLIYAPNGRGKTTLCDILRSLKTGSSAVIEGRRSLAGGGDPEVELLLENGVAKFENGAWSDTLDGLEVYDARFVFENVYAGECVEHEQRRNLYNVIVGEQGVALRGAVDALDDESRKAGRVVTEKESAVSVLIPGGALSVKEFVALEKDAGVDAKIAEAKKHAAALGAAAHVKSKALLAHVRVPKAPSDLEALLSRTLEDVADDAEATIKQHMTQHMSKADEQWLVRGVGLVKGKECPFCAQSLDANELLEAYKAHFGGQYQELKDNVSRRTEEVRRFADESAVLTLQRTVDGNSKLLGEWKEYVSVEQEPELDVDRVRAALTDVRAAALAVLEEKMERPLDKIEVGDELPTAEKALAEATKLAEQYNATVDLVNNVLRSKQEETEAGELANAKRELRELECVKTRHATEADKTCKEYGLARLARKDLEVKKQEARNKLEEYSGKVFQRYQKRINRLLSDFGATFRIEKTGERYKGGKPSSTYCLRIEGEDVELGDTKTPLSTPSFKNTLSAGDKSALALAFFLAKLESSVDLSKKVVVLDDPFTSQDASRQTCTQQEIRRLVRDAAQVVVLSHDRRFLKRVWDGLESGVARTLQFSVLGDTVITEWDIESVQDEYVQTYTTLWLYCNRSEGDPQIVVRTIRPLLEGYLRMKLPNEFKENEWLGDYVKQIRDADAGSPAAQANGILSELVDLKDYSKRHHHPGGAEAPDEPVDAAEVLAFGKRALKLVEAF